VDFVTAGVSGADVASLRQLLGPESVAVVGASRHPGNIGRAILRNIVSGGFSGSVYAVNSHAGSIEGVECVPSVADLPGPVDLAVIAVPPDAVPAVAAECGTLGVRVLTVITAGLGTHRTDLLSICRRHGMRLVGPNCFGVAIPSLNLNATLAATHPAPGVAGLVVQSGGVGVSLLENLSRLGIGVSSFVSVGDKYDVSSNDMLTWWAQDGVTRIAVLYVESFGSPRKFARTARRVGQTMPVLTVLAGRSAAGQRAAASHTAAAATAQVTQEALFGQAGIIRADTLGELVETAALIASQPLPGGNRVAIVSNAGGAGVLAADACTDSGLEVAQLSSATRSRLRTILPAGAAVAGPVDTTAAVPPSAFRTCLEEVAADDGVDAVLAVAVPTAICDLREAVTTARTAKPVAVVLLDQAESVKLLAQPGTAVSVKAAGASPAVAGVPAYAFPEGAARALGHAARHREWRDRQVGRVPELTGLRAADARGLVTGFLARHRDGGWLPADMAAELLAYYQIPLATKLTAGSADEAVGGVEVLVGVVQEPVFGPLVVFGLGGVTSGILGDHAARLSPLTDTDADELIQSVQAAPLLAGHRGTPPADTAALADLLLRVSRLADDLPEVAELDLNPVMARPDGVTAADVRVRVSPAEPGDPFLRRLR
jgi:acyl-CoA synthetase (NDP forming)